ncbi:TIGR01212 family radical SAM protein [Deferribacteres bacterium DY0037]
MTYIYKFSEYLKERFGEKVWKVPVNAGFTCPNRDGHAGIGGCIYCSVDSFDGAEEGTIAEQVAERIEKLKRRGINKYIIYFQSYSNTYGTVETIRERVNCALVDDGIVAVHIGTRPDVIDREKLEYLQELNAAYEVVVEYGLQSANDATLAQINRGHTVQDFKDAVALTHEYGLKVCAHVIFGLPGDSRQDMISSVQMLTELGVFSVKFHHLHVVKGTVLEKMFLAGDADVMSLEEYIDVLSEAMGYLGDNIVVARISGDAAGDTLVAPIWNVSKNEIEQKLIQTMQEKGITQGSLV